MLVYVTFLFEYYSNSFVDNALGYVYYERGYIGSK